MKTYKLVVKQRFDTTEPYLWKGWYENRLISDFCYKTNIILL